jgi:tetratricopeptide (TPR) repeat protein
MGANATAEGNDVIAERALKLYLDLHPESGEGYLQLGILYRGQGKYEMARQSYEASMLIDPALRARALFRIGQTYLDTNRAIQGIEPLEKALAIDAQDYSLDPRDRMAANYWIGVGYMWQNDPQSAELYLRRAINYDGEADNSSDWIVCGSKLYLGQSLHRQGRLSEALDMLNQVIVSCSERKSETDVAQMELESVEAEMVGDSK